MLDVGLCVVLALSSTSLMITSYFYRNQRISALYESRDNIDEQYEYILSQRKECDILWEEEKEEEVDEDHLEVTE